MRESTFVEISVQSTLDSVKTQKEILTPLAKRHERSPYASVSWRGTEINPVLRLDYESHARLEDSYKKSEHQLKKFLDLVEEEHFNLNELKASIDYGEDRDNSWKFDSLDTLYVILRYRTNHKTPLRQNYKFGEWFFQFFNEHIMFEEIDDGFLIFYHRQADYSNSNLDKTDPAQMKQWLEAKNINIESKLMKHLFSLMYSG